MRNPVSFGEHSALDRIGCDGHPPRARDRSVGELRHRRRAVAVCRKGADIWCVRLEPRDRRNRAHADRSLGLPHADLHPRQLGSDREARSRIYGGVPFDGGADDRRFLCAGFVPLLHHVRSGPDPDVSDYRHLGRRGPDLRKL